MDRRIVLTPMGKLPVIFAVAFGAVLPIIVALTLVLTVRDGELSLAMMLVVQAGVAAVSLAVVLPMWRREAAFDGRRLRVKATWYTREAPLSAFDLAAARVVDIREHTQLKPVIKTNGFALPGFWAGHFRLRDRRKAFCLVTDPSRVLALPHEDGRVWLLSVEHPQAVLDVLRRDARAA